MRLERSRTCVKLTFGGAVILAFAEELSVSAICVAGVILAFVEEVSVSGIRAAAVILAFAEELSV